MRFGALKKQLQYDCGVSGACLELVREDRSSRWCVGCGKYNGNLGGGRTFKCGNAKCLLHVGRDAGAALMILKLWIIKRCQIRVQRSLAALHPAEMSDLPASREAQASDPKLVAQR
jgi:transposase